MAVREVFTGLDRVEAILSTKRYLTGNQLTEADVRLFTTLIRFDKVYVGHFKVYTITKNILQFSQMISSLFFSKIFQFLTILTISKFFSSLSVIRRE